MFVTIIHIQLSTQLGHHTADNSTIQINRKRQYSLSCSAVFSIAAHKPHLHLPQILEKLTEDFQNRRRLLLLDAVHSGVVESVQSQDERLSGEAAQ